jgi:putative membrane-bound dehydrogenase-like protein
LYAEDTTGDGKADRVETLYSGFAAHNYQARVNSLHYGLDGWVYGSCGLFGGTIRCVKTGKTVALGDRDFRIQPDTGELEPTTGTTQQGRVRDDRGNWFGCDNSTLIKHYVLEDHYLRRNPFVVYPNTSVTVEPSNRLFSLKADAQRFALSGPPNTVTAACGLGIYRDELLGREYFGNAFTCEPVNLVVTRRILKPNGSTFQAQRAEDEHDREFLASTDGWHRPVHVTTGPDGALWVADMYRFLIEHPRFLPPADLATIDVRAGAGLGRIYRIRPVEKPIRQWHRLDQLDTPGLVAALDSPNGWQRDQAMMLLIWKNDPAAKEPLEALARGAKSGLTRLQALCTLGALNRATKELLTQAIQDSDAGVQRHALRLIEPHIQPADALRIAQLAAAKDSDPQVRLQLAYAFGNGHWGPEASQRFLTDLVPHCTDDPHLAAALASSLNPHNLVLVGLSLGLRPENEPPQQLLRNVFATATALDSGSQLPKLLDTLRPSGAGGFRPWQLAAVASVLDAFERQGRQWGQLAPTIRTAVEPVVAHARSVLAQESATEAAILAAIPLLGRDPTTRTADVNRLANLLGPTRPVAVQAATVTALARIVDDAVPSALVGAWGSASPALRGRILDALLARPAWHAELLAAIETNRIAPGQIDAARRQRLTDHPDAAIRTRAAKLFEAISADRQKVIADYQSALGRIGDTTRGRAVFARSCAACHALDGVGHAVGPDLAALANKSPRYLLSEILDPTRNLDSRYAEYRAVTKDERTVTGILIGETATTITLRGQQGKDETILRSDLESLRGSGKSLMPEGLEKDVSKQDMADLLAYLTAQDPPHKKLAGNDPAEITLRDNALTLPATRCFIYGRDIVFEPEFQNIGYWHGAHDYVVWKVRLDKPAEFDVYLDYACHPDAAGNTFAIDGVAPPIRGKVATTGGWDQYKLVKLGTVKLPAGVQRITVRPDGLLRSALFDLRTLYLVPIGTQPQVLRPKVDKPLSPVEMARQILDEATPPARRESLIREAVPHAAEVIRALTADLPANAPGEEYRRIPWIWRVAIAAGRTNEAKSLTAVLELSLPKPGEKLRDWQAVVLGGGVINGLSLENVWPGKRLMELIGENTDLRKRWVATLQQAQALADANSVPTGTRYDALRIVALDDWKAAQPRLVKYLSKQANAELQHGAVSGLVDCTDREAATALVAALPDLTDDNRNLAISGLLRTPERIELLLTAIETGKGRPEWLSADQRAVLLHHPDATIRKRVAKVLK